mgnify:CR=1 FL=1
MNFKYSDTNKRYHTLDYFYKHKFGCKVFKVSLNAGFTCPNMDGTVGHKGCIYCSNSGSGEYGGNPKDELTVQFEKVKTMMHQKWPKAKYIGYFQARTNTYAPVEVLKEKYETILKLDNVVGLSIATRPDAISDECLDYLEELNKRTFLTIELGLQSMHEVTNKLINRCHSLKCFDEMVSKLKKRNIFVVAHVINGLPYENKEMMLETVKHLNDIKVDGVKIHMLSVLKGTPLEKLYLEKPFSLLSMDEYIDIVCDELELLDENIVIERLTGDPDINDLVAPLWLPKKINVLNGIDKEMKKRNSYQGKKVE